MNTSIVTFFSNPLLYLGKTV